MEFIKEIRLLENTMNKKEVYLTSLGSTSVLVTALETTDIYKNDGTIIIAEQFQKSIARYVAAYTDSSYFIKLREPQDNSLEELQNYIEENNIKLILAITGVSNEEHDIKIKPLNKMEQSIINELKESFIEANITNTIVSNQLNIDNTIDVIEIEISRNCRNIDEPEKLENVCNALINFIEMYANYVD